MDKKIQAEIFHNFHYILYGYALIATVETAKAILTSNASINRILAGGSLAIIIYASLFVAIKIFGKWINEQIELS